MRRSLICFVLLIGATSALAAEVSPCDTSKQVVGACLTVHGRLKPGNGTPGFGIWPVGTMRMLVVLDGNGLRATSN
jgi:hypothetical protein